MRSQRIISRLIAATLVALSPLLTIGATPREDGNLPEKPEKAESPEKAGKADASASASIRWNHDYSKALELAKTTGQPLMLDFGADWCGWCKKLDRETFGHVDVIQLVRENFVAVKIDCDKTPEIQKKYGVTGLPTIVFVSPQGEELQRMVGFRAAEDFLKDAKKPASSSRTLKLLREAYEETPDDIDTFRAYSRAVHALGNADEATSILERGLKKNPKHAGIIFDLADIYRDAGQRDRARTHYEMVLKLSKSDEEKGRVCLPLGRLLVAMGDHKAAVEVFGKFLAIHQPVEGSKNETIWEVRFLRGYTYSLLKDADKALEDLKVVRDNDQGQWGLRANYIIDIVEELE